ncbi:unnamed protein product [Clavelina lepadiformis]|uniref:Fibrinogen C-terminal domain-containing protein n=1 Tax=Clavelina lepadiformis TaxID=159417 RepID=A0ABP0G4H9_CLALP
MAPSPKSSFSIESAENLYRLRVSGYSGNAGDSLTLHNGRPFSKEDNDSEYVILCSGTIVFNLINIKCYKLIVETAQLTIEEVKDGGLVAASIQRSMESGCVNQVEVVVELSGIIGRVTSNLLKKLK